MDGLTRIRAVGYRQTVPRYVATAEGDDFFRRLGDATADYLSSAFAEGLSPQWAGLPDDITRSGDSLPTGILADQVYQMLLEFDRLISAERAAFKAAKSAPVKIRRPPVHLVILVLLWLVLIAGPLAEMKLPDEIQAMLSTEVGTVALGLAITQMMNRK